MNGIREGDSVELLVPLEDGTAGQALPAGTRGTAVHVYPDGGAEIEAGTAVVTARPDQYEAAGTRPEK